jgi:hypothetical protein
MRSHKGFCAAALVAVIAAAPLAPGRAGAGEGKEAVVRDIGSRLELFVDRWLIGEMDGAELRLHRPEPREVVLRFDEPWEGRFSGYVTVLQDGDLFRLYYRGYPEAGKHSSQVTCMAESRDGVEWTKPKLGLFEVAGTKENNVILADAEPVTHNFCPFLDGRAGVPEEERFKALGGSAKSGLIPYVSADGVHWRRLGDEPVITQGAFDSQNVPFWSEHEQRYVCYFRVFRHGVRSIARTTSEDFLKWTKPQPMSFGDTPWEHLYTNQTHPYFRAPHIYIATPARFFPGKQVLSPQQAKARGVHPRYVRDCADAVLMSTRGGIRYDRTFLEAFIRPGLGLANWASRCNYPALGVVPTGEGELSLYVQRRYAQPEAYLQRLTLRTDGFVSVHAPYAGGEMITQPLTFKGKELVLNVSTSAAGSVRVEIRDAQGTPVPGYTLADSVPMVGDEIERGVTWKGKGSDVGPLAGKPVRLRFVLKDADLYALRFRPAKGG